MLNFTGQQQNQPMMTKPLFLFFTLASILLKSQVIDTLWLAEHYTKQETSYKRVKYYDNG